MDCAIEKVKVKSVSPVKQALTGLRGIDLSISNLGAGRGLVVNLTPRPFYARERDPVPIVQESGWVSGPIWMQEKNLAPPPNGVRTPQHPDQSETLYRLCYSCHRGRQLDTWADLISTWRNVSSPYKMCHHLTKCVITLQNLRKSSRDLNMSLSLIFKRVI